jgi:ubiquitin carboxyl-terminal hydrolase 5/13
MGHHHPDYGTADQQDASFFFMHFHSLLERQERQEAERLPPVAVAPPCSHLFKFSQEQRIQCSVTGAVSYSYSEPVQLSLHIPLDAATNRREVQEYKEREQMRQKLAETQTEAYIGAVVCSLWVSRGLRLHANCLRTDDYSGQSHRSGP